MSTLFHRARKLDSEGQVDDFWMLVEGDTITATGSGRTPDRPSATDKVDVGGNWLVPGFIDLHCHGGGGHSYDDRTEEILAARAMHRSHGTTRSVLSLVANPLAQLRESLAVIADLADADPTILGSHLEGRSGRRSRGQAASPGKCARKLGESPQNFARLASCAALLIRRIHSGRTCRIHGSRFFWEKCFWRS